MNGIDNLVAEIEEAIEEVDEKIDANREDSAHIINAARDQGAQNLSRRDQVTFDALFKDTDRLRAARKRQEARLARAKEAQAEERESDRLAGERHKTAAQPAKRTASLSVGRNERVYRPDTDPHGSQFLMDVARSAAFGDPNANERLTRHTEEERVERGEYVQRAAGDLLTGGLGGLVVPQYLTDLYAPAIAAMRPLANLCNQHVLPESGMSLVVPKITTASSAGLQATQLTAVSATSVVETDLSLTVQTAAGQQNISRQAVERGTGIDDMVAGDLFKRVATLVDSTILNAASTGLTNTAQVTTYTSGAPTGVEAYPFIFQASSKLEQALLTQAPVNTVVMHPRRWNWFASRNWIGSPSYCHGVWGTQADPAAAWVRASSMPMPCLAAVDR